MSRTLARRIERVDAKLPPSDPEVAEHGLRRRLVQSGLVDQLEQIAEAEQGEVGSLEWLKHQAASLAIEARLIGDRAAALRALSLLAELGGYSGSPAGGQKPVNVSLVEMVQRIEAEEAAARDRLAEICPP